MARLRRLVKFGHGTNEMGSTRERERKKKSIDVTNGEKNDSKKNTA